MNSKVEEAQKDYQAAQRLVEATLRSLCEATARAIVDELDKAYRNSGDSDKYSFEVWLYNNHHDDLAMQSDAFGASRELCELHRSWPSDISRGKQAVYLNNELVRRGCSTQFSGDLRNTFVITIPR